jgi:uncharacterized protein (TIGR03437 family)
MAVTLSAQTLTTLVNFNGINGVQPVASLVQGSDGSLYGTASTGGTHGYGTIFEMTPSGTLATLYNFDLADGATPQAGLVEGTDGNFYGTTSAGGANGNYGTIFKVNAGGTLTTLHSFSLTDGAAPQAGLVQGSDGNFYGTTSAGGANGNYGTIFKVSSEGTLTTLHSFSLTDGATPQAGLVQGNDGNFYGTTSSGGANPGSDPLLLCGIAGCGDGTIFRITPAGALTTLYNFSGPDGADPQAGLMQATDGSFYGTTSSGGSDDPNNGYGGTIFKVTQGGILTTLYMFCAEVNCTDGQDPQAGLIQGADGNLYGTTNQGGNAQQQYSNGTFYVGAGTIFRIALTGALTSLHSFAYTDTEGGFPVGSLIQANDGNFYGTTEYGGSYPSGQGGGTVFSLSFESSPAIAQDGGVISGASFQAGIVPNSWITILGTGLSSRTDTWANAIFGGNLPTSLDGVSVNIGGEPAYISYISPSQINAVAPNVGPGMVPVTVTNSNGTSSAVTAVAEIVQPSFFQWGSYAVATRQDYSLAVKNGTFPGLTTEPARPGDVIIFWGTGFGPTTPSEPTGVEVPSSVAYNTANAVTVTVGGVAATVYGAALASGYAGLYQVAVQIPVALANGDYSVIATLSGAQSPSSTLITVQE